MSSDKQIQANRENARHSTGPRTPEGKARSAANGATHALTGRHAVLPGESVADFDQLLASLGGEWDPQTETESQQVELIAHHWWRLLRIALTDEVDRISRYEVRIRRAYHQAIETLRKLQSKPREKPGVNSNPIPVDPPPDQPAVEAAVDQRRAFMVQTGPARPVSREKHEVGQTSVCGGLQPASGSRKPPQGCLPSGRRDDAQTASG